MLRLRFKPGSKAVIARTMRPAIIATRAEDGNNGFFFFEVNGRADEYLVLERWRDQASLDWHFEQPYTKDVLAMFSDNLAFPISEISAHETFLDDVSTDAHD